MSRPPVNSRPSQGNIGRLKELLHKSENRVCADCGAPDPKWASANIGVFICLKCCGVHRGLGSHISKVLSVTLDEWTDDEIDSMVEVGGNSSANKIYEAFFPEGYSKIGPDSNHEERMKFIRSKYEFQEFLKPSLRIVSLPGRSSLQSTLSRKIIDSFRSSNSSTTLVFKSLAADQKLDGKKPSSEVPEGMMGGWNFVLPDFKVYSQREGMVEFIGMLKIKVIKGTNLAIRDLMSSDPYVVLTLGKQTVQTQIIKSNLNPVWNEDLMLSVPEDFGAVKLQVYDYDTFSADDIMGEAEVDIQPLITSAMAFGDPNMFGNMQIGKWLKSHDNCLMDDSIINIVDGKVKQEMLLKLQNVESGDIALELEWIPLDQ